MKKINMYIDVVAFAAENDPELAFALWLSLERREELTGEGELGLQGTWGQDGYCLSEQNI